MISPLDGDFMLIEGILRQYFPKFRYVCSAGAVLLLIIISALLFNRSIGGPFPFNTRGPLADPEFYKLGMMPDWENTIKMTDNGLSTSEILLSGKDNKVPPVRFGEQAVVDATPEISNTLHIGRGR